MQISPLFEGGFENEPPCGMWGGVCLEIDPFTAPGCPVTFTDVATLSLMIDVHGCGVGTGPPGVMMMCTSPGVTLKILSNFLAAGLPMVQPGRAVARSRRSPSSSARG